MVSITDVEKAQQAWGDGIVAIGDAFRKSGDYVQIAHNHVETLYAYEFSKVLFKPTMASFEQFRPTFESALSYFVASNKACSEDKGFAIKENGWTNVRFYNSDIIISENTALAMGNYFFTNLKGDEIKVEFTFGYLVDSMGDLRINLHHSSMPASIE
tara:strand:+ start:1334 stop:1804 length:471 start_codon:yes stop_codon:yes gene_type:complete